jgi:hypothetical protein
VEIKLRLTSKQHKAFVDAFGDIDPYSLEDDHKKSYAFTAETQEEKDATRACWQGEHVLHEFKMEPYGDERIDAMRERSYDDEEEEEE